MTPGSFGAAPDLLSDDRKRDEIAKETLLSFTLHKTTIATKAQENVAKVQEKLAEEEIEKMVKGEEDEESYASAFADSMLNDDDDSGTRIEPESHKENPKTVHDEDKNKNEKKDDDDDKKNDDNDDHTYHTLDVQKSRLHYSAHGKEICNWPDDAFRPQYHDDHQEDDAPPEGEKRAKRQKTSKSSKSLKSARSSSSTQPTSIPEDTTPELIDEFQNVDKHILTIYDYARMMATVNYVMSNQFKDAKKYAYHLEQTKNYMENQIVWESRQEDIKRSKSYAQVFYGPQRNPNKPPRLEKNSRPSTKKHDFQFTIGKIHGIREEVVRITIDQQHGLDYMEQIIVMRGNDKPVGNKKLPDQGKLNRTNNNIPCKEEKRVMYLVEIVKLCDATLERVLKEVKLKIFKSEPWKKPHLLGELDLDILKAYEREISKRLRHRV
nr:hypothetical protein [Tanacetum cinerariifolium]